MVYERGFMHVTLPSWLFYGMVYLFPMEMGERMDGRESHGKQTGFTVYMCMDTARH